MTAPNADSSSPCHLPERVPTLGSLSSSSSSINSSISTADAIPRSNLFAFYGWRDQQYIDGNDVEQQSTQRFPTSYLRHRCDPSADDAHEQPNYVWAAPEEDETGQVAMMEEDVDVKIEDEDESIQSQEEAAFWRVSGPGFVWRYDKSEVCESNYYGSYSCLELKHELDRRTTTRWTKRKLGDVLTG